VRPIRRPTRIAAKAMTTAKSIQPHVFELDVFFVGAAVVVVVELDVVVVGRARVVVVAGSVVVVVGGTVVVVVGATVVVVTGAVVVVVSWAAARPPRATSRIGVAERARRSTTERRRAFEYMGAAYGQRPMCSGDRASRAHRSRMR
jgi:hypothetical protein